MIPSFIDSSIASALSLSLSRPFMFEDQTHVHSRDQRGQVSPTSEEGPLDLQTSQFQEPAYMISQQPDQHPQQQLQK